MTDFPMPDMPTGPQLNEADLKQMDDESLEALAGIVHLDYRSALILHKDDKITDEELRWVVSDAERVRDELVTRGLRRGEL